LAQRPRGVILPPWAMELGHALHNDHELESHRASSGGLGGTSARTSMRVSEAYRRQTDS
jgi:hypothetical protein